jgi:hypothetical protein
MGKMSHNQALKADRAGLRRLGSFFNHLIHMLQVKPCKLCPAAD